MQIRIDIDAEKQKAATQDERQGFLTALFLVASRATADYGAHVDFSDAHHWVITFPDEYEPQVSALFAAQGQIGGTHNPTPWLYTGRVGHDVPEGFCSCGGYHVAEDGIQAGTKTVAVLVDGEVKRVERSQPTERNEHLKLGFTGTRERLPQPQIAALFYLMKDAFPFELHHGDCKGADAEASGIFNSLRLGTAERVVMHPQTDETYRAFCRPEPQDEIRDPKPPLDRNQDIVDETERLVACPRFMTEELQSGTWATIRRALKANKDVTVVWPDGTITPSFNLQRG